MKKRLFRSLLFLSVFMLFGYAQAQTVSGTVSDANGPLPGATVLVKGTSNGTTTDFDGKYTLNEVVSEATLVASFVGYITKEVAVNGQSTVDITLVEDANVLSEVVVVGYTTQTRGDITGAVSSVNIAEATKAPIVNAAEALEGRVTGVSVINSGRPGGSPKINIRGFGTSNNTNPLFIIDGVQTDNGNVLNSINASDIEQINVLKDGAAAIYGARASNGVVIITTKNGSYNTDKVIISFDAYTGISRANNLPDLLNAQQHGDMLFQSLANDGSPLTHAQYGSGTNAVVPASLQGYTRVVSYDPIVRGPATAAITPGGTDWLDAITQNGLAQNFSVSAQSGTATSKYYMSANFLNREGVLINTGFKQGSTRLNSEFKVKDKITIGEHMSLSFSSTNTGNGAAFENGLRSSPLIPLYDDEGRFAGTGAPSTGNARSPLAQLERGKNDFSRMLRVFGDVYLSAELVDGLTFKTTVSGRLESFNRRAFQALDPEHGEPLGTNTLTEQGINNYSWTWSNTLNYNKKFGEHSLNVLVGIEALEDGSKGNQISRSGFFFETPDFYLLDTGTGAPSVSEGGTFEGSSTLFSIFGTANYSYMDKYFVTGTLRRDESSRFLGDNKSDVFPSFSAGWLLSKEDFFSDDGIVSRLKVKASYGQLGNQTLPANNPTINISGLSEALANYSFDGNTISTGVLLKDVGNPDLKWETSETTNFGVEMGFLNNALSLELDIFNITTEDLITRDNSLIGTTAIDARAPLVNLGNVKNTGFDLSIGYSNETSSGFSYGIQANISKYKNEVTALISDFQTGRTNLRSGAVTRSEVGRPLSSFYGREVIGLDANGRFEYRDVNNDGTINDDDRTYIGSPHPDFTFGVNLTADYKGFDFSAFFSGSQGNDIYNYNKIYTDFPTFVNGNRSTRVLDSWTPANTNTSVPALSASITNDETASNSYFIEDGSFVRLKNLQIGYTFDSKISDKLGMDSFRLYVQGTNLFTITGYDGFDPEIISNDNLSLGIDFQVFPPSQVLTFGVNLKF